MICDEYLMVDSSISMPNPWEMELKKIQDLENSTINNIQPMKMREYQPLLAMTVLQINFQLIYSDHKYAIELYSHFIT